MMKPRTNRVMGGRTGRGAILARGQGDQERADDQADDLGAEVLHRLGGLQLHGARHVADEARGAHGHVSGVAGEGQKRHSEADQHADQGQALFAVEEIQGSPFLYVKMNRSHSILRRVCARTGPQACGDDKAEHAQTPFETENNASRVKARRNRRLAECVGCGQKARGRMIALAEFAQAMPYCKKRLLPCQRRQALILPERQEGRLRKRRS